MSEFLEGVFGTLLLIALIVTLTVLIGGMFNSAYKAYDQDILLRAGIERLKRENDSLRMKLTLDSGCRAIEMQLLKEYKLPEPKYTVGR